MIALTRRYRFPAAHVLRSPRLSDADNVRVYGKCANPNGHGHDYGLEVTVTGAPDPDTGRVVDRDALDAVVRERVLEPLGYRMLNELPAFAQAVPTAENIARVVHGALAPAVAALAPAFAGATSARLLRVRVVETRRNHFDYGEPV